MKRKPVRIIDSNFNLLGEIDNYESMFLIRRWHGVGEMGLEINRYKNHTDKLVKGNMILIGSDLHKVYIIKHREIELDENGKITENWIIKATALKHVLTQRLTLPTSTAYDSIQADTETVMKHYVTNNVVNPSDTDRIISNIEIAPNQNRGSVLSWQSRFKNLAEELTEQSLVSGIGWNFTLDIANKKWVFDVKEGNDLTASQSVLPPVIFSPKFDSLKILNYSESELNYRNNAYVAGQGKGTDRRIIEVGNSTGMNRHELFVDARDVDEEVDDQARPEQDIIDDLMTRGQQALDKMVQEEYLEGQMLTKSPFEYETDYDLGDIVTIQNKGWGVTMDARITEIKEVYEVGSGFQIEAIFGNDKPTFIDKIKQRFSQFDNELKR